MAKAAVAQAPNQADGLIDAAQLAEWLAFTVAEYVARGARGLNRKAAKALAADKRDPYIALPMVEEVSRKGNGRRFWAVKRTGDYAFDCALGSGLAKLTGDVIAREHLADTLRYAILDRVKQGEVGGVEVAFLSAVVRAAARGW